MSYTLEKALPADAEEIGEIMQAASSLMPRIQLEPKNVPGDEIQKYNTACRRCDFATCERMPEKLSALKAVAKVEGREEIAAYAIWGWSPESMSLLTQERAKANISYPQGGNTALHAAFYGRLRAMEARHTPPPPCYSLLFLLTSPSHQRRGVGAQLVKYGLEKATRGGVPIFLSGSPMGYPLYKKLGFKELDKIEIDLQEYGWDGREEGRVHVHVAMMWEPEEKKEGLKG